MPARMRCQFHAPATASAPPNRMLMPGAALTRTTSAGPVAGPTPLTKSACNPVRCGHVHSGIQIGSVRGYLPACSRSWQLGRPWLWSNASGRPYFLQRAREVNVRTCRDEGRPDHRLSGRTRYEDGTSERRDRGVVDARGVGPSGGCRSRSAIQSLGLPAPVPADMGGCRIAFRKTGGRTDRVDLRGPRAIGSAHGRWVVR